MRKPASAGFFGSSHSFGNLQLGNYVLAVDDLALSVSVSSDLMGFAPYGRLTFFVRGGISFVTGEERLGRRGSPRGARDGVVSEGLTLYA